MKPLLLVLTISGGLFAATIPIYNTGVGITGIPLGPPDNPTKPNLAEIHFSLISGPGVGGPGGANTLLTRWQNPYVSEDPAVILFPSLPNARWISPALVSNSPSSPSFPGNIGTYILRQTFNMAGLIPATATLSGRFAADNCAEIWLNTTRLATTGTTGSGIGCGTTHSPANFQSITAFTSGLGFINGINNLDIRLRNDSGPTGVIVEFQGTADEVPEPAVSALIGIGLVAIALRRKLA